MENNNYNDMMTIIQNIELQPLVNGTQRRRLYDWAWFKLHNSPTAIYLDVGTNQGNTAITMASALKHQKPEKPTKVYTIDNYTQFLQGTKEQSIEKAKFNMSQFGIDDILSVHVGDDIEFIQSLLDNSIDMVFDDSDHAYMTTLNRLRNYVPKMNYNSVITGHDYFPDSPWVVKAVEDFREEFKHLLTGFVVEDGMYWMFCKVNIEGIMYGS